MTFSKVWKDKNTKPKKADELPFAKKSLAAELNKLTKPDPGKGAENKGGQ